MHMAARERMKCEGEVRSEGIDNLGYKAREFCTEQSTSV